MNLEQLELERYDALSRYLLELTERDFAMWEARQRRRKHDCEREAKRQAKYERLSQFK